MTSLEGRRLPSRTSTADNGDLTFAARAGGTRGLYGRCPATTMEWAPMQALGGAIGSCRQLSTDLDHQHRNARHIHVELQEIIPELEGILARSSAAAVPSPAVPSQELPR